MRGEGVTVTDLSEEWSDEDHDDVIEKQEYHCHGNHPGRQKEHPTQNVSEKCKPCTQ